MSNEGHAFGDRRPAWRVLRAMERALRAQHRTKLITQLSGLDSNGRLIVSGQIDLASLAEATANALKAEFDL